MTNGKLFVGKQINLWKGHHLFYILYPVLVIWNPRLTVIPQGGVWQGLLLSVSAFFDGSRCLIGMLWAAGLQLLPDQNGGLAWNSNQQARPTLPVVSWPPAQKENVPHFKPAVVLPTSFCAASVLFPPKLM